MFFLSFFLAFCTDNLYSKQHCALFGLLCVFFWWYVVVCGGMWWYAEACGGMRLLGTPGSSPTSTVGTEQTEAPIDLHWRLVLKGQLITCSKGEDWLEPTVGQQTEGLVTPLATLVRAAGPKLVLPDI